MAGNRRQNQPRFHHGKAVADADARPTAKRQISVFVNLGLIFRAEPLWPENFRLIPPLRITMGEVAENADRRAFGDGIAANFGVFNGGTAKTVSRRIQS